MARTTLPVAVALSVRVPVNASGSLVDGASRIVGRAEIVDRVNTLELVGLEPGLNDTVVDVRGHLQLVVGDRGEDLAVMRRELETAVGVREISSLEPIDAGDPETEEVAIAGAG